MERDQETGIASEEAWGLDMVKQYLRIDTDADDGLLGMMMGAAEAYIIAAVGSFDSSDRRVRILFLALMQDFYENRTYTVTEAQRRRLAHTQASIILQLQCEGDGSWQSISGD